MSPVAPAAPGVAAASSRRWILALTGSCLVSFLLLPVFCRSVEQLQPKAPLAQRDTEAHRVVSGWSAERGQARLIR
jgi:hypothetical protein